MKSEWGHSPRQDAAQNQVQGQSQSQTQNISQNSHLTPLSNHNTDHNQITNANANTNQSHSHECIARSHTPTHAHTEFSPAALSIKLESLGSPGFAGFAYARTEPSPGHHTLSPLQPLQQQYAPPIYPRDDTHFPALSPDHDLHAMAPTQRLSAALSPPAPGSVPSDYGEYAQEHFLLDQFGSGMYEHSAAGHVASHNQNHLHNQSQSQNHGQSQNQIRIHDQMHSQSHVHSHSHSNGSAPVSASSAPADAAFSLDGMEFIAPQSLGQDSRAYPPSDFPENTPALGPADVRNRVPSAQIQTSSQTQAQASQRPSSPMVFQSPVLPSQNSKSYNQEHLIQKQRQRSRLSTPMMTQQKSTFSSGAKPTSNPSFTPLASPAVTPLESQVNSNKRQVFPPAHADFEPLTSPALKAQQQSMYASSGSSSANANAMDVDRRRSSTAYAGDDYSHGSTAKRRTPHSTPKLSAVPSKLKRSPSLRKVPQHIESASDNTPSDSSKLRSSESTPMLPPQGKKTLIDSNSVSLAPSSSPAANFGPGTLMGFTMNRLAEQQGSNPSRPSPGESPSNASQAGGDLPLQRTISGSGSTSAHNSVSDRNVQHLTSSSETSPMLEAMSGDFSNQGEHGSGRRDRVPGKKTSHKIAEQGRRNRMNQAVHELTRLIPENLQEGVTVPSKATTIELAGVYIRKLLHEIDLLKNGNNAEDRM